MLFRSFISSKLVNYETDETKDYDFSDISSKEKGYTRYYPSLNGLFYVAIASHLTPENTFIYLTYIHYNFTLNSLFADHVLVNNQQSVMFSKNNNDYTPVTNLFNRICNLAGQNSVNDDEKLQQYIDDITKRIDILSEKDRRKNRPEDSYDSEDSIDVELKKQISGKLIDPSLCSANFCW